MKMEQIECSETSSHKIQTPGNNPEESIQHLEHGESFKSRICNTLNHLPIKMEQIVFRNVGTQNSDAGE